MLASLLEIFVILALGKFWDPLGETATFQISCMLYSRACLLLSRKSHVFSWVLPWLTFFPYRVALAIGAAAERGRMLPCIVFMFVWSTIIYDPIACWTWNPQGWSYKMGGLDFAGGTPVHISSGSAALAYSLMLGKRRGHGTHELNYRPHNVTHIVLGTVFLWVGWVSDSYIVNFI